MPELPEVETVRRTLAPLLIGRRVERVTVHRSDYVHGGRTPRNLLVGGVIASLERRGKQLAVVADDGRTVCLHLGMSGQVFASSSSTKGNQSHVHIEWRLRGDSDERVTWLMRDPRRFGGVWTHPTFESLLNDRWRSLGPDGLDLDVDHLAFALKKSERSIKSVLLDQRVVAGIGNIYCDESLFRACIRPQTIARRIGRVRVVRLAEVIGDTLREAIDARGSTLRDYRDANGASGGFSSRWRVYGRAGEPCLTCDSTIRSDQVGQRTTAWCPQCQR